jgi:hypothetical protein
MEDEKKPRWKELCAQAAVEHDNGKLLELVTEINRLLEPKSIRNQEVTEQGPISAKSVN